LYIDDSEHTPCKPSFVDLRRVYHLGSHPSSTRDCNSTLLNQGYHLGSSVALAGSPYDVGGALSPGENGNGKTTLVKLVMGELEATEGEVKRCPHSRYGLVTGQSAPRGPD
jgi:hypothetical protein